MITRRLVTLGILPVRQSKGSVVSVINQDSLTEITKKSPDAKLAKLIAESTRIKEEAEIAVAVRNARIIKTKADQAEFKMMKK